MIQETQIIKSFSEKRMTNPRMQELKALFPNYFSSIPLKPEFLDEKESLSTGVSDQTLSSLEHAVS